MSDKTKEEILKECLDENSIDNQKTRYSVYNAMNEYANQCQEKLTARIAELENDVKYWQYEFDHWYKQAIEMANKVESLTNLAVMELSCKEDKYEIPIIGSSVIICGEIQTTIIRIEHDKYYFLDNEGIEKWDTLHVIELTP